MLNATLEEELRRYRLLSKPMVLYFEKNLTGNQSLPRPLFSTLRDYSEFLIVRHAWQVLSGLLYCLRKHFGNRTRRRLPPPQLSGGELTVNARLRKYDLKSFVSVQNLRWCTIYLGMPQRSLLFSVLFYTFFLNFSDSKRWLGLGTSRQAQRL